MIDRGRCHFVEKVRNAQKIGVKFVIIADNTREASEELVMTDDGSGETITIASMIIRKNDADLIKESLAEKERVVVKIDLEFIHKGNGKVDVDFWFADVYDFTPIEIKDIKDYLSLLSPVMNFKPHILTH